jgi:hypothetical protein
VATDDALEQGRDASPSPAQGVGSPGAGIANSGITPSISPSGIANNFNPLDPGRTADTPALVSNPFAIVAVSFLFWRLR